MSGNINFNGWINDDGSENYKCRAWVNFNGTGTVAIRASGGVGSITDNGTGDYTVNLTTAMPDGNYSVTVMTGSNVNGGNSPSAFSGRYLAAPTSSTFRIRTISTGGFGDSEEVFLSFFR